MRKFLKQPNAVIKLNFRQFFSFPFMKLTLFQRLISFCREFSNERTRVERRETFRKLRMKENFSKAFEGYFQWIIRAGTYVVT